jgi:hypothetical protein
VSNVREEDLPRLSDARTLGLSGGDLIDETCADACGPGVSEISAGLSAGAGALPPVQPARGFRGIFTGGFPPRGVPAADALLRVMEPWREPWGEPWGEPWRGFMVVLREERRLWEARLAGWAEPERRGCD